MRKTFIDRLAREWRLLDPKRMDPVKPFKCTENFEKGTEIRRLKIGRFDQVIDDTRRLLGN